jgi:hypothetical protein
MIRRRRASFNGPNPEVLKRTSLFDVQEFLLLLSLSIISYSFPVKELRDLIPSWFQGGITSFRQPREPLHVHRGSADCTTGTLAESFL